MTAATVAMAAPSGASRFRGLRALVGGPVLGVVLDGQVNVHANGAPLLLGQVAEQAGGAGEEGEAAQQVRGQAKVGEGCAAGSGAVERQPAAGHLGVHPANPLAYPPAPPPPPSCPADP